MYTDYQITISERDVSKDSGLKILPLKVIQIACNSRDKHVVCAESITRASRNAMYNGFLTETGTCEYARALHSTEKSQNATATSPPRQFWKLRLARRRRRSVPFSPLARPCARRPRLEWRLGRSAHRSSWHARRLLLRVRCIRRCSRFAVASRRTFSRTHPWTRWRPRWRASPLASPFAAP